MKALIVEDDVNIARFVARVLEEEGFGVEICERGADAITRGRAGDLDVILLDWMLPDVDGLDVCRALRREGSVAPILMLTARGEVRERVEGLKAGADDYIVKPFEIDELLARIQAVRRRARGHGRLQLGALELDRIRRTATLAGAPLELSAREFELLAFLGGQEGRVVPRAELLTQVWAAGAETGSNLVEVQISRLRDKLGAHAWMIDTVRGRGYRLIGAPP